MSTRGVYGFRKNGQDKLSYKHCDSYPEWLGRRITEAIQQLPTERLNDLYDHIKMVSEGDDPGDVIRRMVTRVVPKTDYDLEGDDWYWTLHEFQGRLDLLNELYEQSGIAYMTESRDFITDSLFCEFGYIINLDTEMLEFWVGFQHKPQLGNRYGEKPTYKSYREKQYYPCALKGQWPLDDVRRDPNACVAKMVEIEGAEEEEEAPLF